MKERLWPDGPLDARAPPPEDELMTDTAPVRVQVRGRVLVVTIDRPQRRNAIDRATADGLDAALNCLEDDPALWCGVLTGAGCELREDTSARGGDAGAGSGAGCRDGVLHTE